MYKKLVSYRRLIGKTRIWRFILIKALKSFLSSELIKAFLRLHISIFIEFEGYCLDKERQLQPVFTENTVEFFLLINFYQTYILDCYIYLSGLQPRFVLSFMLSALPSHERWYLQIKSTFEKRQFEMLFVAIFFLLPKILSEI